MAKVLIVSEKISATAWQLAMALKSQQHEVSFLTSHGEAVDDSQHIEILSYFKKWSAIEAAQLLPTLLNHPSQILHFVLEKDRVTAAHMMLWGFHQSRPATVFAISLLHIEKGLGRRNLVRYLIQRADIVTCPSVDTLAHLRGIHMHTVRQGRGLLPPILSNKKTVSEDHDEAEFENLFAGKKYFIRPFSEVKFDPDSSYFKNLIEILRHYPVVLLGSQDHWSLAERRRFQNWLEKNNLSERWILTGIFNGNMHGLLNKAEGLWLADLDLTPMELTYFYVNAIDATATLILDAKQARLHAPLWRNGENCWILGEISTSDLLKMPAAKLIYNVSLDRINRQELVDAPINELNRLFNKALSQKANI